MMAEKFDFKTEYRDLYLPKAKPMRIDVPAMNFICVDGRGSPQGQEYQSALQVLYSLSFTIKMSRLSGKQPEGYFEYVVPPLEGLWWGDGGFDLNRREEWLWTAMIRQPDFVTPSVFAWAVEECRLKKPEVDVSKARFDPFLEGLCVQMLHVGPFSAEDKTIERIEAFLTKEGLRNATGNVRKHHEIYLSDPRRTAPEKLRTVLRIPVEE